jgi:hypothetical protein
MNKISESQKKKNAAISKIKAKLIEESDFTCRICSGHGNQAAHLLPKQSEHDLQVSCINWFRLQYPNEIIFAIPNGSQRNIVVAMKLKAEGVLSGVSDLFLMCSKGHFHGFYIEMKSKGGKLTENQKLFFKHAENKGYLCSKCETFDEFMTAIKTYMSF